MTKIIGNSAIEAINAHSWYHSFEVLPGVFTPGRSITDAAKTFDDRHHLPQDLTGLKVLDIGALDGPYSFELERRGAEVTSIDIQDPNVTGFNIARMVRGSKAKYIQGNVYHLSTLLNGEKFDIITYFGVWYHLKHPIIALEQIWAALKDDGIVCFEGECLRNYVQSPDGNSGATPPELVDAIAKSDVPYSLFYSKAYKNDNTNWYVPNAACVKEWFNCAAMEITSHGFWDDHPHQRMFGNAKKIPGQTFLVDNPVW